MTARQRVIGMGLLWLAGVWTVAALAPPLPVPVLPAASLARPGDHLVLGPILDTPEERVHVCFTSSAPQPTDARTASITRSASASVRRG